MLTVTLWILAAALAAWLILTVAFMAYPTWKRVRHVLTARSVYWPMQYFWTPVGLLSDVVFNLTWGTVIFREFPREWMFSDRVRRRMKLVPADRKAMYWSDILNAIDPGHI